MFKIKMIFCFFLFLYQNIYSNNNLIIYKSLYDNVRIRDNPGTEASIIGYLFEDEEVVYFNEITNFKTRINIGNKEYNEPWVKVKKKNSVIGWVYKGLLEETEPLFRILIKGKFGYIDRYGNIKIKTEYSKANQFNEGLALVKDDKIQFCYIKNDGTFFLKEKFDYTNIGNFSALEDFSEGLAFIQKYSSGYKYCFMNKRGEVVFFLSNKDTYINVSSYDSNYNSSKVLFKNGYIRYEQEGAILTSYGFLDKEGNIFEKDNHYSYYFATDFSEGFFGYWDRLKEYIVFSNTSGSKLIQTTKDTFKCKEFSEGLAGVLEGNLNPGPGFLITGKWGFIDKNGKFVIAPMFDDIHNFNEGFAAVKINDKWGFIDKNGHLVIDAIFDDVKDFSEGYAFINKDEKWGFINKKGQVVIKPIFDHVNNFSNGLAEVVIFEDKILYQNYINRKKEQDALYKEKHDSILFYYFLDQKKEYLSIKKDIQKDRLDDLYYYLFSLQVGIKIGYIDYSGNYIWNLQN